MEGGGVPSLLWLILRLLWAKESLRAYPAKHPEGWPLRASRAGLLAPWSSASASAAQGPGLASVPVTIALKPVSALRALLKPVSLR